MSKPKIKVNCSNCSTELKTTAPTVEIGNTNRTSLAIGAHEKPVICQVCGQGYVVVCVAAQMQWGLMAVEPSVVRELQDSLIQIVAPTLN